MEDVTSSKDLKLSFSGEMYAIPNITAKDLTGSKHFYKTVLAIEPFNAEMKMLLEVCGACQGHT